MASRSSSQNRARGRGAGLRSGRGATPVGFGRRDSPRASTRGPATHTRRIDPVPTINPGIDLRPFHYHRQRRRPCRFVDGEVGGDVEVDEQSRNLGVQGDRGYGPHLDTAGRAEQGVDLEDARQTQGPGPPGGACQSSAEGLDAGRQKGRTPAAEELGRGCACLGRGADRGPKP